MGNDRQWWATMGKSGQKWSIIRGATCICDAVFCKIYLFDMWHLLPGVLGNPGMLPSLGLARLAWNPDSFSSSSTACGVKDGPKTTVDCSSQQTSIFLGEKQIYLVRWIGKLDNPLNITMQGVPESKTVIPVRKKWSLGLHLKLWSFPLLPLHRIEWCPT